VIDLSKDYWDAWLEYSILGGLMLSESPPTVAVDLDPEWFTSTARSETYSAIIELVTRGKLPDELSVWKQLQSWGWKTGAANICEIAASAPLTHNLGIWANKLAEEGRKRQIGNQVRSALEEDPAIDPDVLAGRIQDAVKTHRMKDSVERPRRIRSVLKNVVDQLEQEAINPQESRVLKTGLPDLDEVCCLLPRELTVIAGRPGMGKTALAGLIAANCARDQSGGSVALFSLEMSDSAIVRRMVAAESKIKADQLVNATASGRNEIVQALHAIHDMNLWIDDRPRTGGARIRQVLSRLDKPWLVIVDYLQLMEMNRNAERRDLQLGDLTKELKAISKEFDCHVIVLSQLNRAVEKRQPPKPNISDLRDSGNIEEDADRVLLLYRAGYYSESEDQGTAEIIIGKQRNGQTGSVHVAWRPETQTFGALSRYEYGG
jgi:replicative DNA helicase